MVELFGHGWSHMKNILVSVVAGIALVGCNSAGSIPSTTANLSALNVAMKWCAGSPEFSVRGVPSATRTLNFRMIDKIAPQFQHGGGSIPVTGSSTVMVPCGSLSGGSYVGPNPPPPRVHEYEWTVTALDSGGKALAAGQIVKKFPE